MYRKGSQRTIPQLSPGMSLARLLRKKSPEGPDVPADGLRRPCWSHGRQQLPELAAALRAHQASRSAERITTTSPAGGVGTNGTSSP